MPTADCRLPIATLFAFATLALAQESATPTASPSATELPLSSSAPTASATPATPAPARNVRISFLPPPLEGKISLGIYAANGQLVRVLHQEAELDEFTVGADALVTKWDGKNDDEEDLPPGKYHASGFLVGHLKIEDLGKGANPAADSNATGTAPVKLMPNPLAKDAKTMVELAVGFDDVNSYLKTTDGLPLFTISPTPNLVRASITKNGEKSVDVFEDDGTAVEQYRVSNIDKMMTFDCGDFELK
jgi:hypothetical protein